MISGYSTSPECEPEIPSEGYVKGPRASIALAMLSGYDPRGLEGGESVTHGATVTELEMPPFPNNTSTRLAGPGIAGSINIHKEPALCLQHTTDSVGSLGHVQPLVGHHCLSPPPPPFPSFQFEAKATANADSQQTRDPGYYCLGHGTGYSKGTNEGLGWRKIRGRMRKEVFGWLTRIVAWPFKDSSSGTWNEDIVIYIHVHESVHTVNEVQAT